MGDMFCPWVIYGRYITREQIIERKIQTLSGLSDMKDHLIILQTLSAKCKKSDTVRPISYREMFDDEVSSSSKKWRIRA